MAIMMGAWDMAIPRERWDMANCGKGGTWL